jgi:hypothetical protein
MTVANDTPTDVVSKRRSDEMTAALFADWLQAMSYEPEAAALALGCGLDRVNEYAAGTTRIPRFVRLACSWLQARRDMKKLQAVLALAMSADGFRVWTVRMGYTAEGAATALGLRTSKVSAYLDGRSPVPQTVRLACLQLADQSPAKPTEPRDESHADLG